MEDFDADIDKAALRKLIRIAIDEYTLGRPLQPHEFPEAFAHVERRLRQILPVWNKVSADPKSGR
ncbi:hypothetical protein [Nocardia sp. NPDC049149]|uniref:hypothetical protein n=1 Tax=Nocardia sp. NPDC049149 TaxID=3364315 RepID=UPI0037180EC0